MAIQIYSGIFSVMLAMKFSDRVLLVDGYRHQDVDCHDSDFLFGVEISNPLPGLIFRF